MMSSQRGNCSRSRPQKHKNAIAFMNTLHDTSLKTKAIVGTKLVSLCQHCKEIIEWKIKYKKYKPLSVPKKCTKCYEKTIKKAYYTICDSCIQKNNSCGKCAQPLDESVNSVYTCISTKQEEATAASSESEPN